MLKMLYILHLNSSRPEPYAFETLKRLFQTRHLSELIRHDQSISIGSTVSGMFSGVDWQYTFSSQFPEDKDESSDPEHWIFKSNHIPSVSRPVFIPSIDMMGHTRGFLQAASEVVLDFDQTCFDIVTLLGLERNNGKRSNSVDFLSEALGGTLEYEEGNGRFYLNNSFGRLPFPLVAEGIRKIATLVRLAQNGWLEPGTTLFWDEPEVNLNPKLMDEVVRALLALARSGVQVFIATHSYVILKELDLQSSRNDYTLYFGFDKTPDGTVVNSTDDLALLSPNSILEQYDSLYDRELTRSTGRNRSGELVR